jgi:hypothetical protein
MYNELIDGSKLTNNRSNRWTMILGWASERRLWLPQRTVRGLYNTDNKTCIGDEYQ